MEDPDIETLRKLASCWSLAGDDRLLTILQNTHQKLVTRCQEANSQLEQMVTALDDASIALQNVNNQLMALSSSQFIESRVYDDDDVTAPSDSSPVKESQKPSPLDELSMLKRSISVIESSHDVITIMNDSDTESDTDDELNDRLVMKVKDSYSHRPLPYIIGSEPWKNKWHVGLLPEDSDTDSTASKVDRESDQYSQSEPEDFDAVQPTKVQDTRQSEHVRNLSETSSEVPPEGPVIKQVLSPADIASELARRLGGVSTSKVIDEEEVYEPPVKPAPRKIYKPQEPVATTIFPDEPPPLDAQSDSDSDIFAELHRHQPYSRHRDIGGQLFGDTDGDKRDVFQDNLEKSSSSNQPSSIFDSSSNDMFEQQANVQRASAGNQTNNQHASQDVTDDRDMKKPLGGVSLFGSSKGAESIGAAILKRNTRKSSTSDDESENNPPTQKITQAKKEKDIFNDLFSKNDNKKDKSKANNIVSEIKNSIKSKKEEKVKKDTPKAVDLFSDNLFDDIDDIFTTNKLKSTNNNQKSIFEDDDDLFSDIAEPKTMKTEVKSNKKNLFDSDDDLFSENIAKVKPSVSSKPEIVTKVKDNNNFKLKDTEIRDPTKDILNNTSIFDNDDDDLFSNIDTSKSKDITKVQNVPKSTENTILPNTVETKSVFKSTALFDDDDDDGIFSSSRSTNNATTKNITTESSKTESNLTKKPVVNVINTSTLKTEVIKESSDKIEEVESNNVPAEITTESNTSKNIDSTQDQGKVNIDISEEKVENKDITNPMSKNYDSIPEKVIEDKVSDDLTVKIEPTVINKMLESNNNTTDDDFSEHDFDDDPIIETKPVVKEASNTIDIESLETDTHAHIFDNNTSQEENIPSPGEVTSYESGDFLSKTVSKPDNNTEIIPETDIFAKILTEPPAFEKPKEPKRSKNVNALFDDDSDDEALFFKKVDVITDEKPDDFTAKQHTDRLFDIFTDEPPDVDFTNDDSNDDLFSSLPTPRIPSEVPAKTSSDTYDLPNSVPIEDEIKIDSEIKTQSPAETSNIHITEDKIDDLFKVSTSETDINDDSLFKKPSFINEKVDLSDNDDELFKSLPALPKQEIKSKNIDYKSDEELFKSLPIFDKERTNNKDIKTSVDKTDSAKTETKKVGKLKVGFNINVNALLPGASPKKVKPIDSNDGQSQSNIGSPKESQIQINIGSPKESQIQRNIGSPKEATKVQDISTDGQKSKDGSKLTRSVSFDGEPDSEVLDNKLSKERPRIQVKRRPSTRKARREAVRKSAIDFGEDSTDNSSSVDGQPKNTIEVISNEKENIINSEMFTKSNESIEPKVTDLIERPFKRPQAQDSTDDSSSFDGHPKNTKEVTKSNDKENIKHTIEITKSNEKDKINTSESFTKESNENTEPKVKDMIERPLNRPVEPQIADTNVNIPPAKPVKSESTTKIVYILNDDDIFNTSHIEQPKISNTTTDPIDKDLNNLQSSVAKENKHKEIETLGKIYQTTKSSDDKTTKSLFGDENVSEDDDLFRNKKPMDKVKVFDSDSDEELFGTKKKVERLQAVEKVVVKKSLFGDDDDDDLFGVKIKKSAVVDPPQQPSRPAPSVSKSQVKSSGTEPVFDDPLSMFGDDD